MIAKALILGTLALSGSAQAYTLKQHSYRARDGTVIFACVTKPYEGAITFIPDRRFQTGTAAVVVPASNYAAFIRMRYPTSWYAAAADDIAQGSFTTPSARQFERETRKEPSVMFMAEGDAYGNYDRPHLPLSAADLEAIYPKVAKAISNCRVRSGDIAYGDHDRGRDR